VVSSEDDQLIVLYAAISKHALPVCSGEHEHGCLIPYSCCSAPMCDLVIEQAKWDWNTELPRTGHPKLPLMREDGCTAPPHMRPLCAVHVCPIQSFGQHLKDPEWTKRYWELRHEIEALEWAKRSGGKDDQRRTSTPAGAGVRDDAGA
jgi:hypothetical protein